MKNNDLDSFCKTVRKRTEDNTTAAKLVGSIPGQLISILRQELDSLIRVVYLLSISDLHTRSELIAQTLTDQPWTVKTITGKTKKVTDREMVELASHLMGWTKSVYKFGCAFIHLSSLHGASNPLNKLSNEDRIDVLTHMRYYHGGPTSNAPSFEEFCVYLPDVLKKISGNLGCYVEHLEKKEILNISEI